MTETTRCGRTWVTGGNILRSCGLSARHAGPCHDFGAPSSASPPPEQLVELPGGPPPSLTKIDGHTQEMRELATRLLADVSAAARDTTLPAEVRAELGTRVCTLVELLAAIEWPGVARNSSRFAANRTASFGYLGPTHKYERADGDGRTCYAIISREHERPIRDSRCSRGWTHTHTDPPFTLTASDEGHWTLAHAWATDRQAHLRDVARVRTRREEDGSIEALWPMAGDDASWARCRLPLDTAAAICGVTGARLELPNGTVLAATAPEESAAQPPSLWTMQSARAFVAAKLWTPLHDVGWVPCITGDVLQHGRSTGALDIILHPRFEDGSRVSDATYALEHWIKRTAWEHVATGLLATF